MRKSLVEQPSGDGYTTGRRLRIGFEGKSDGHYDDGTFNDYWPAVMENPLEPPPGVFLPKLGPDCIEPLALDPWMLSVDEVYPARIIGARKTYDFKNCPQGTREPALFTLEIDWEEAAREMLREWIDKAKRDGHEHYRDWIKYVLGVNSVYIWRGRDVHQKQPVQFLRQLCPRDYVRELEDRVVGIQHIVEMLNHGVYCAPGSVIQFRCIQP